MDDRAHYKRAQILVDQQRPKDAERECLKHLEHHPEDPWAHSLLATALSMQKRRDEAVERVTKAIQLNPTESWFHYVLGDVHYAGRRYKEARVAVDEAIRLSPKVARYWGLKANCESAAGNWKAMLAAAETGLEQDATHQHCKNLRALALAKLGNKDAASALFSENLGVNPENALTFAYQGWTHLHNGEPNDAITAFSECLRLQPNLDWARLGMMTALRDRLWLFRLSRAVSSWRALLALLIGVFVTGAATAISWIYWEHHHWIAPLALLCTLVCIANFLCYFLACLRIHRMRDDFLKTIMLFDARGQYLLTQEERRKAWRCALMAPLGFILGALMVTFSERKHASDAGFIMLMSCLCVVCYIALGLKWLANRDRGH